jgi:hypothetical protein
MSIIIGSKPYRNINLNNLIDNNFEKFYRMNMAIPNNNNGTKDSTAQILNCHVYDYYINNKSLNEWGKKYKRKYLKNIKFLENFFIYIHSEKIKNIVYNRKNNTGPFRNFLKKNKIKIKIRKELRCGYGAIYNLLDRNIKPYIIGFSLDNDCETYYNKNKKIKNHDVETEIKLLKGLHNRNFIDATFCLLEDIPIPTMDCSIIYPNILPLTFILNEYSIIFLRKVDNDEKKLIKLINSLKNELDIKDYYIKKNNENIIVYRKSIDIQILNTIEDFKEYNNI